jgi:uncharacterized protein (TIGR04141 family)
MYTNGKKIIYQDINLVNFLETVKDQQITLELLKQRKVSCADADHNATFKTWSIHKCLYVEIDYDGNKCVFNNGQWYKINTDFVTKTNKDFLKIAKSALNLPQYTGGGEGVYNEAVYIANKDKFANLDKDIVIHGGGKGKVEVCDLFTLDKQFIHVKIYGKSSIFSHLFSQGYVSGRLLSIDAEFRQKVKAKLQEPFASLIEVNKRPDEGEFTIVFAVISEQEGNDLSLPFFSRVNFYNFLLKSRA